MERRYVKRAKLVLQPSESIICRRGSLVFPVWCMPDGLLAWDETGRGDKSLNQDVLGTTVRLYNGLQDTYGFKWPSWSYIEFVTVPKDKIFSGFFIKIDNIERL